MNCPNCGSPVKEGRFCNYCGAKLPDDTTRVEVNVNQRFENVAEIKRTEYESAESKRREEERLKARSTKRKACIVLAVVLSLITIIGIIIKPDGGIKAAFASSMILAFMVIAYIIYQMITGKW